MVGTLDRVTALLLATVVLLVGHGLQLTLLPLHAQGLGWSTSAIGSTGSAYFLGFLTGCIINPTLVSRVGHIRNFMVMAAIATIALLGAGLFVSWTAWLLLRFATGFALSGLYMVIESWLNEVSPRNARGTILAIYTSLSLIGMALGQSLMGLGTPRNLDLFGIGAVFMCLAIIPVGLTTVASPPHIPSLRFRFEILLQASRVALIGTLLSGLVTGAFWIIGPVLGRQLGLDSGGVALLIGCGIIGGAVAQLPAGRLSDRVDRRIVIGAFAAGGALAALAGAFFAADSAIVLYAVFFLVGAGTLPIYALCIAHASDNSNVPLVELTSGTLMMNSVGSIIGPLAVAALMGWFGSLSYFAYVFVCLLVVSLWTLVRGLSVKHVRSHEEHAAMLPRTTQAAAELILPPTGDAAGKSDDSTNPS